jgi:hypothetical protein
VSYLDRYREPMGTSVADNVQNRAGANDAPRAQTVYTPSVAPRVLPAHVRAARRRQVLIDASVGEQAVFDPSEHELQHQALKQRSNASAVNRAIMSSRSHGGSLGGGTVLARPADHLPWLFFGAGD